MKTTLLLPFLFFSGSLLAQDFTAPDTSLIRKQKVRLVKIEFVNDKGERFEHKYMEYDRRGKLVKDYISPGSWYYTYAYGSDGKMTESRTCDPNGIPTNITRFAYPAGKSYRVVSNYTNNDTVNPAAIYHYDLVTGNTVYQEQYVKGKLTRAQWLNYKDGKIVSSIDSVLNTYSVTERRNNELYRITYFTQNGQVERHKFFLYENGFLSQVKDSVPGKTASRYSLSYNQRNEASDVYLDGKALEKNERTNWLNQYRFAMPRPQEENYGLPVPEPAENRKLVYDKKGLMTEEIISSKLGGTHTMRYVYTYAYFK